MGLFKFINSQLLKAVQWTDSSKNTIVYKFPMDGRQIQMGSKLTVRESQIAILVSDGKIADVFGPGMHKLETSNMPVLTVLKSWAFGFKSPFYADVYFINTKQFTNQKWGTTNPIAMRDKDFGTIRVRGFGAYSFKVNDATVLLKELFGTNSTFNTEDINDYLKTMVVANISDTIAESKISALDLASNLLEFNDMAKKALEGKFEEMGLKLTNLIVENLSFPKAVEEALDTRSSMGIMGDKMGTFMQYQTAMAARDAANNEGSGIAGAGVGMGAGVAMGSMMASAMKDAKDTPKEAKKPANKKICPDCGAEIAKNAKFCTECGHKFSSIIKCPKCGADVKKTSKFCKECGHNMIKAKKCKNCEADIKEGTKFCTECGTKVSK